MFTLVDARTPQVHAQAQAAWPRPSQRAGALLHVTLGLNTKIQYGGICQEMNFSCPLLLRLLLSPSGEKSPAVSHGRGLNPARDERRDDSSPPGPLSGASGEFLRGCTWTCRHFDPTARDAMRGRGFISATTGSTLLPALPFPACLFLDISRVKGWSWKRSSVVRCTVEGGKCPGNKEGGGGTAQATFIMPIVARLFLVHLGL